MTVGSSLNKYDVIVIGGGPAGASAALILGRSRLNVLLIDKATPRNIRSHGVHGFLTRHDISPLEMRKLAHAEVIQMGVEIQFGNAIALTCGDEGFTVKLETGVSYSAARVVLATGLRDKIPEVEGMELFYGTSIFHCPFCDGWELRDKALAAYAHGGKGVNMALGLMTWSSNVMLFTDGTSIRRSDRAKVDSAGITVHTGKIARITGHKGQMQAVELVTGEAIPRDALFFDPKAEQQWNIAMDLGCKTSRSGAIYTDTKQRTHIPGLYVTGDAAADPSMVAIAAADGVKAALNIVQELQKKGHWLPAGVVV